jgi:hypothetical protein
MSELEDLRRRVEALEGEVDRMDERLAVTRSLSTLVDRHLAELCTDLREYGQALKAFRETQLGQGRALEAMGRALQGIADRLDVGSAEA